MIFDSSSYDDHEKVVFCRDAASGLRAIIAIHRPGPKGRALGGCRMVDYDTEEAALTDVLRLSKGMTWKSAVAGLPLGGAKAVILGDPAKDKSPELFKAMAEAINALGGRYITSVDVGISGADVAEMQKYTEFAVGANAADPSPMTALGVYVGLKSAVMYSGREDLKGLKVGIQGVGKVGYGLAEYLHADGAELYVTDVNAEAVARAVKELGAKAVSFDEMLDADLDVFSPNALGGVITPETLARIKAPIIAGGANNQLKTDDLADVLKAKGVLYAPDYVINGGGIIMVDSEVDHFTVDEARQRTLQISDSLKQIFEISDATGISTLKAAEDLARQRYTTNWAVAAE